MNEWLGKKLFESIKNATEVLDNLKSGRFCARLVYPYTILTLFITLPHNLIKKKIINLVETTFDRQGTLYLACDDKIALFTSDGKNGLSCGLAKSL